MNDSFTMQVIDAWGTYNLVKHSSTDRVFFLITGSGIASDSSFRLDWKVNCILASENAFKASEFTELGDHAKIGRLAACSNKVDHLFHEYVGNPFQSVKLLLLHTFGWFDNSWARAASLRNSSTVSILNQSKS